MFGVVEDDAAHEVGKPAGLLLFERGGISHQHEAVRLEGAAVRGVDIGQRGVVESQTAVESQAACRDLVPRGVDFEDHPLSAAEGFEERGAEVPAPQVGPYGQVFDVAERGALPPVEQADEFVAAADGLGVEARVGERPEVVRLGAPLPGREGFEVEFPGCRPVPAGGRREGYELHVVVCHVRKVLPQDSTKTRNLLMCAAGLSGGGYRPECAGGGSPGGIRKKEALSLPPFRAETEIWGPLYCEL